MSNQICPNCDQTMTQQFVGLYHCKCGTSRLQGKTFQRTPNMVFCLKHIKIKNKTKQVPYIRYNDT